MLDAKADIRESKPVSGNPAAKYCPTCGRWLEVESFDRNRSKPDGLDWQCSWCDDQHSQTPEYKAYIKAYKQTPEYKAYMKAYMKAYDQTPEHKAYNKARLKAYDQTPERKAYNEARKQTPEYRAYHKAYMKAYYELQKGLRLIADMM